jgi:hypothetical protein
MSSQLDKVVQDRERYHEVFRLQTDVPEWFDMSHWPSRQGKPGEAVVHRSTCRVEQWPRGQGWATQVPKAAVLQLWPSVSLISQVWFCEHCMIEKVK